MRTICGMIQVFSIVSLLIIAYMLPPTLLHFGMAVFYAIVGIAASIAKDLIGEDPYDSL